MISFLIFGCLYREFFFCHSPVAWMFRETFDNLSVSSDQQTYIWIWFFRIKYVRSLPISSNKHFMREKNEQTAKRFILCFKYCAHIAQYQPMAQTHTRTHTFHFISSQLFSLYPNVMCIIIRSKFVLDNIFEKWLLLPIDKHHTRNRTAYDIHVRL